MVSDPASPTPRGPTRAILFHVSPSAVIEEKGLKLKLTVTDTPGFGDQINNDKWWVPRWAAVPARSVQVSQLSSVELTGA